jgi:competence protein ComEA
MPEDKVNDPDEEVFDDSSFMARFRNGDYVALVNENRAQILFALTGLILVAIGLFLYKSGFLGSSNNIEVIEDITQSQEDGSKIYVEVAGAVEKPGVFAMQNGDRINDLLVASGGFSADADREWVEKTVNRAAILTDGQKVYIPHQNEQSSVMSAKDVSFDENSSKNTNNIQTYMININTASQSELESLRGIGPVTGKNIIDHRPYSDVSELLSRGVLKKNVYEDNKDKMTVY